MEPSKNKLLSLKLDYVFKKIFGDKKNSDLLIDFLSAALDMDEEEYESVTVEDPHLNRAYEDDKLGILDIRILTKTGKIVNVEMQVFSGIAFRARILYYISELFTTQINRGEEYTKLKKVVSVVIADFPIIEGTEECDHRFTLYDKKNEVEFSDLLEIDTFDLTKSDRMTGNERLADWLRLFNTEEESEMAELAERNPKIKKTIVAIKEMSESEVERRIASAREKELRDKHAQIMFGEQEGEKRGEQKGIEIGKKEGIDIGKKEGIDIGEQRERQRLHQEKLDSARIMKRDGMDVALIGKYLGLAAEEIAAL
jgi:predicted transposase/invertase (TIGR01784 family)